MDARGDVQAGNIGVKRRQNGTESVRNERKRSRVSGLQHTNYKNVLIPAKNPPEQEVSNFNLKISKLSILTLCSCCR